MSELNGQMNLMDVLPEAEALSAKLEGYDEDGQLMNVERLDEEEAGRLAVEINAIKAQTRNVVVSAALEIGARLIRARGLVPHGQWARWLSDNVDYSERKALDLMNLYEGYGGKALPEAVAALEYSKLVALLQLPEGQREEVAVMAAEDGLSVRQLQAEIDRLKLEAQKAQLTFDALLEEKEAEAARAAEGALNAEREKAKLADARAKAAEESSREASKALQKASDEKKRAIQQATDAVDRANKQAEDMKALRDRIAELESEAGQARSAAKAPSYSEAVAELRVGYKRLVEDFKAVAAMLDAVNAEDEGTAEKYRQAIVTACETMAGRLKG